MKLAITLALLSALSWGAWTLFVKLATESYTPIDVLLVQGAAGATVAIIYALVAGEGAVTLPTLTADARYLIGVGVFGALAPLAYYAALDAGGSVAIVSTIEASYFVVAAILGVLVLGETLALTDGVAIFLVLVAVGLFTV